MKTTPYIATYTGKTFYPLEPDVESVDIVDIAHSLSLQCRYNGHVSRFYSVAEHSLYLSEAVPSEHALTALLHDATEAYLCDLPRPIKSAITIYREVEDRLWKVVANKFNLPSELPDIVKQMDAGICNDEMKELMSAFKGKTGVESYGHVWSQGFACLHPVVAKDVFLRRFEELSSLVRWSGT
jgi:hypothetical protein